MDKLDQAVGHIHSEVQKLSTSQTFSTREMSSMDDLTHNFTDDPVITRFMLAKYGQVFIRGKRFAL